MAGEGPAGEGGTAMLIGQTTSVSTWPAILLVSAAFGAAIMAAVRAERAPGRDLPGDGAALPDVDLLAPDLPARTEPRPVRVFGKALGGILLMYALFDRGFAWFHLPGTPLFVGEMVVALGLIAMASSRVRLGRVVRRQPALSLLVTWMAWGLGLLVLAVPTYGLDALRDSAIWYYGVVAIFAVFLLVSDPARLGRWMNGFRRLLPLILLWMPIAIVLRGTFGDSPPHVPGSEVSIFSHRSGNIAVFCAIAIGFIWLVDREKPRLTHGQRLGYSTLAVVTILIAGAQNRGGLVAAVCGILAMMALMRRRRAELGVLVSAVVVLLVTAALLTDARIPFSSSDGRDLSASQLADNIVSVFRVDAGGERQRATTEWRLELWGAVLDDIVNEAPATGFGPGPDLGERYGVSGDGELPLRNPHNSHLGVASRMGLVGVGLWVALWSVWVIALHRVRARFRVAGRSQEAGFAGWLVVSAMMILINAIFDPTLEGPQVAMWLWMIYGAGAGTAVLASTGPRSGRSPTHREAHAR